MSASRSPRKERGSVLLPVVAALLILCLAGVALAEMFGAQRLGGVLSIESSRAFWIAEAGLWHAANEGADIATPVPFAGGTYTVVKRGSTYTSTGTFHDATRVVAREFAP
jgi:hypothetical protein